MERKTGLRLTLGALTHHTPISVFDFKHLTFAQLTKEVWSIIKQNSKNLSEHYPERATTILAFNTPSFFPIIWNICWPLLPEATRKKVRIPKAKDVKSVFLEFADEDQIPPAYGGTWKPADNREYSRYASEAERRLKEHVYVGVVGGRAGGEARRPPTTAAGCHGPRDQHHEARRQYLGTIAAVSSAPVTVLASRVLPPPPTQPNPTQPNPTQPTRIQV